MVKKELVIIADYSQTESLRLDDICEICHISPDFIRELMEFDILELKNAQPEEWLFDLTHVQRIKTAVHLQHDLEVNLPGIRVILDLLDEMERLRAQADILEKHFLKR